MVLSKWREITAQYAYVETVTLVAVYVLIGYTVDPDDLCMIDVEVPYLTILLALITLFHGITSGLLAIVLIGVSMYMSYPVFDYTRFLSELVLVLVYGEFHYYWHRKVTQHTQESRYTKTKLDELSKAFYTLKISHDQLEKNYVVKPMSLRNSIRTILDRQHDGEEGFDVFLTLLEKSFQVQEVTVCRYDKGKLVTVAASEYAGAVVSEDPLIRQVTQRRKPIYISNDVRNDSPYIAVIPAMTNHEIAYLLLIEKMPFMAFNKDNLISVSILFEFFTIEMQKHRMLDRKSHAGYLEYDFEFEYVRMVYLHKQYDVGSSVLVLRCRDALLAHRLYDTVTKYLRSLDHVTRVDGGQDHLILLLFPLVDRAAVLGFLERALRGYSKMERDAVEVTFFDMSQDALFREYVEKVKHA